MPGEGRWVDYAVVGASFALLLLGIVLFAFGAGNLWRAHASERWPETTARSHALGDRSRRNAEQPGSNLHGLLGGIVFNTRLAVSSQHHQSAFRRARGRRHSSEAELILLRYPAQAEAPGSYNPGDHPLPQLSRASTRMLSDTRRGTRIRCAGRHVCGAVVRHVARR